MNYWLQLAVLISFIFLSQSLQLGTDPLESNAENDQVGLNKLKRVFLRNAMNVIKNVSQVPDEDAKSRNKRLSIPADELLLLDVERDESLFEPNINVIQGDIIVPNFQESELEKQATNSSRKKRRIITQSQFGYSTRWPNRTIPYEFDYDANDALRKKVYSAISLWHRNTCIRFEPYSKEKHANYKSKVVIRNRGHCAARVGYVIDPFQPISISDVFLPEHCPLGSVIHELGHVIGFRHEHTRTDRENHIKVHYERMQTSQRPQYELMENGMPGYLGIYYDLFSIMHYSSQGGLLESRDQRRSFLMGQRFTLSFSDVKMANQAYGCDENCPKPIKCQNEGFLDYTCTCRCPDGITGEACETIVTNQPELPSSKHPRLTCDFEVDFCDWINEETRDSEDWLRNSGLTKTQLSFNKENIPFKTGPQAAKNDSNYIYLNSYDQTKAFANSILMSPQILINITEIHCLRFSYHMYGSPQNKVDAPIIGTLSVKLRDATGQIRTIWRKEGSQGEKWLQDEVEVFLEPPHMVIFIEAEAEDWKYGDIAIDDIKFTPGSCNDPYPDLTMEVITTTRVEYPVTPPITFTNPDVAPIYSPYPQHQAPPYSLLQNWTAWSDWSACSMPCGGGLKARKRLCVSEVCLGQSNETTECNMHPCQPVASKEWTEWSAWSACSVPCGNGLQSRNRDCLEGHCEGFTKEIRPCIMEKCQEPAMAVSLLSATWSQWTDWSQCNPVCQKSIEFRFRTRECKIPYNPKNQFQIKNECLGPNKEFKPCTPQVDCQSPNSTVAVVQWNEWGQWSPCSKTCGLNEEGTQTRSRTCPQPATPNGPTCVGPSEEKKTCMPNVTCPIEPPTTWSEWSKCSTTCGNGTRTRIRYCSKKNFDFPCEGKEVIMERSVCSSFASCPTSWWQEWSEWSPCSVTCGQGFSFRKRVCSGAYCEGASQELKPCSSQVDCVKPQTAAANNNNNMNLMNVDRHLGQVQRPPGQEMGPGPAGGVEPMFASSIYQSNRHVNGLNVNELCATHCNQTMRIYNPTLCSTIDCGPVMPVSTTTVPPPTTPSTTMSYALWSEWSSYSECMPVFGRNSMPSVLPMTTPNCGYGIRSRKRLCLVEGQPVPNNKCQGAAFVSTQCILQNCSSPQTTTRAIKFTNDVSKYQNSWSYWSSCSSLCGNGLMTRYRKCLPNDVDCGEMVLEQKTCEGHASCANQTIFMRCSFDQKEYCPLENVNKGTSQWQLTMPKMFPNGEVPFSNPMTGGNYIFINGVAIGNSDRIAIFKTPTISGRIAGGQCLSFHYNILNEKAKFEVNKVNLDGSSNELFKRETNNPGNKWAPVFIGIKARNDFFLEFKGTVEYDSSAIIALDEVSLHPIERCQLLSCTFDNNDACKPNLVKDQNTSNKIWVIERFQTSSMTISNYYLRADLSQIKPGKKSLFGLPVIFPRYPRMCLSFIYLLNGTSFSELKAGILIDDELNFIWQESTNYNGVWKKASIDFHMDKKFQLVFEVYNKGFNFYSLSQKVEIVAIDNVKLTYGSCSTLENIEFEDEYVSKMMMTNPVRKTRRKRSFLYPFFPNQFLSPDCGGVYEIKYGQNLYLQSPGFPVSYQLNQKCIYLVKTDEPFNIQIKMIDLNIEDNDRHDSCNDYLEIRYFNLGQPGPKFCGNLEKYNGVFSITSFRNDVLLIFSSDWAVTQKGFKLEINVVSPNSTVA